MTDLMEFPLNITVRQNADYQFIMAFYEEDDTTAKDMTGYKFSLTVKPAYDEDETDAAAVVALDPTDFALDEDTEVSGGGVDNRVSALIPCAMDAGDYVVDLRILDPAGHLWTWGSGQWVVTPFVGGRDVV